MKNDSIFILEKNLLKQDFTKYSSLFQEMTMIEAQEKGIYGGRLNYLYTGEQLFFLNREVKKLAIKVEDNKICDVRFEVDYLEGEEITNELIELYGYPTGGRMNQDLPKLRDETKGDKDLSNYIYENFTGLSWQEKNNDNYIAVTNFKHNRYFIEAENKLWVHFSLRKEPRSLLTRPRYRSFLGKSISDVTLLGVDPEKLEKNRYSITLGEQQEFGKSFNRVIFTTKDNGNVEVVKIIIDGSFEKSFLNKAIKELGEPERIQIVDNVETIDRSITLEEIISDYEDSFKESSLYLVWQNEGCQIETYTRHKTNLSEIIFKNTKD